MKEYKTNKSAEDLNAFEPTANIAGIKVGNRQILDNLISEEALMSVKY